MKEKVYPTTFQLGLPYQMSQPDDSAALNGLRKLDQQTISAVYDQHFSEVYRYVLYRIGDATVAEDIASDVFVRLLEAAQNGNSPQTNIKGWLIGTASHVVIDHMRRKYRRPEEEISDTEPDRSPSVAAEVDEREQNRVVNEAYEQLTPEQQHVLALRFGQGYSLEETAASMNKNVNAIKALQFRALAALQREVGKVNYE
ncbi:MAG: sigma-70 family RNA polymerase sigma factor [Anaerolineales bacterium]|nr:sigma-70 family RNA polymerase sigma factor [Anaerolineales bacterium]MBP6209302.1 sigma-70 family RNA polymerase sigma factor [Anaerolineales bacterium]